MAGFRKPESFLDKHQGIREVSSRPEFSLLEKPLMGSGTGGSSGWQPVAS